MGKKSSSDTEWQGLIWLGIFGLVFGGLSFSIQSNMQEDRDLIAQLENEQYVHGSVPSDAKTIPSLYFKQDATYWYAWQLEEYTDADGDTQTRVVASKSGFIPFTIRSHKDGDVDLKTKPKELIYDEKRYSVLERRHHGKYIDKEEIIAPGDPDLTILGRPDGPGVIKSRRVVYRGTPKRWRADARWDATTSLFGGLLCCIVAAALLAFSILPLIEKAWGEEKRRQNADGSVTVSLGESLRRLCSLDIDEMGAGLSSQGWLRHSFALIATGIMGGAWTLGLVAAVSGFVPALFGISPYSQEGAVRQGFVIVVLIAALGVAAYWVTKEIRAILKLRVRTREINHLSDLMLQTLSHISKLTGDHKDPTFTWNTENLRLAQATAVVQLAQGKYKTLTLRFSTTHTKRELIATMGQEDETLENRPQLECKWAFEAGRWKRRGAPHTSRAQPHTQIARELVRWLDTQGVGARERAQTVAKGSAVTLQRLRVQHEPAQQRASAPLKSFAILGVEPVVKLPLHWLGRNTGNIAYLTISALVVLGPIIASLWLFYTNDGHFNEWFLAPMAAIPAAAFWFRPPQFSARRNRKVDLGSPTLSLKDDTLSLEDSVIDLSRPFRLNLSREPLEGVHDKALLGIEVVQSAKDGGVTRLRFAALANTDRNLLGLPELRQRAPIVEDTPLREWLWPMLRFRAQLHGSPVDFELT